MAELLIRGATIWAGAAPAPAAGWLSVSAGRIDAVGTADTPEPDADEVVDAPGRHVLPSFVDCHTHLSTSAWLPVAGDASGWRCRDDALSCIERIVARGPEQGWLLFMNMDHSRWPGRKPPSAAELEAASNGRPVFLADVSLHRAVLSETGLRRCNITSATRGSSGDITSDRRGSPTGELWEAAFARALHVALEEIARELGPQRLHALLEREARRHLSYGITDAHDPCISASVSPSMAALRDATSLRVSWSVVSPAGILEPPEADDIADDYGAGPPSAKFFLDGALRCAMCLEPTAALDMGRRAIWLALRRLSLDPLRDLYAARSSYQSGEVCSDFRRMTQTDLERRLETFHERGLRLRIHALGNLAARQAAEALGRIGAPARATLEHLLFLRDAEIEAIARTSATASIQPGFIAHYGPAMLDRGMSRSMHVLPARSLLDSQIRLSISSDNPCGPLDPLHNLRAAVERRTSDGRPVGDNEALSREQAVRAATVDAMIGISGEPKRGLETGAQADFVICSGDPFDRATTVESTWVSGRRAYAR
jgi:predicted amidohydrolase YtcJ